MTSFIETAVAALDRIVEASQCERFVVGYSGGLDSSVLMCLAAEFVAARDLALSAVHIDHGLQDPSPQWAKHCIGRAKDLRVPCEVVVLDGQIPRGMSIEEWARNERYREFKARAARRTCILTAHHLDDHVETVLHNAMRGSGPHGLSGIRPWRRFGDGYLARPLLQCRKTELLSYAKASGLQWIEDPSNADERHTRNLIRRRLLPMLEAGFPGVVNNLQRLADVQTELVDTIDRNADIRLDAAACPNHQIRIDTLLECEPELRAFLLKRWLARAGSPVPGQRHIDQILGRVLDARADAMPVVHWSSCEVRRYREHLYLMRRLGEYPDLENVIWDLENEMRFPWGSLSARKNRNSGIDVGALVNATIAVRFRGGGERCHPAGRTHSQTLKKLFQEWQVPPWERDLTPLILVDGCLAAVGDHCVCRDFASKPGAEGLEVAWEPNIYKGA